MKQELEQTLFAKYPKLFAQRSLPMTQTCMCWGLECGDGWYQIVDDLCGAIQSYIDGVSTTSSKKGDEGWYCYPQIQFTSVKEKYAGIRVYYDVVNTAIRSKHVGDERVSEEITFKDGEMEEIYGKASIDRYTGLIDGMIALSEYRSFNTCETTGKPGVLCSSGPNGRGWLKTLCAEEAEKIGYTPLKEQKED